MREVFFGHAIHSAPLARRERVNVEMRFSSSLLRVAKNTTMSKPPRRVVENSICLNSFEKKSTTSCPAPISAILCPCRKPSFRSSPSAKLFPTTKQSSRNDYPLSSGAKTIFKKCHERNKFQLFVYLIDKLP